ncbi:MAG TPA: class I SAM-dependent methyltransferase [Ornithinimicrobium sp.]|uniref:class I SAM-dependent methyltransferase n=1 Tax=Ornithinimicrobium sp. TaxID=1977084 RepID=UPI002B497680|nr:class I SAM-dependent methyltransferase [Ornithinimicrobium sp.]HKJ10885.1 class I SAM-dependent methyltransferase [Ornithinimicrobium sp.]
MTTPRMYADLARWWPLLSPPSEYVEDAALIAGLLRTSSREVRTVLELGSGGGHNAVHLAGDFAMTLVDIAEGMLAVSRRLNPASEHVPGDMRNVRLERTFDAVLVHDAVDYMLTEGDLAAVFATARAHLAVGGALVVMPDHMRETFEASTEHGGTDAPDGSGIRYLEWTYDPDPADDSVVTEYVYCLRDSGGRVWTEHERHTFGLFTQQRWVELAEAAGFEVSVVLEPTDDDRTARRVLVGTAR